MTKPVDQLAELSQSIAAVVSEHRTFERMLAQATQEKAQAEFERDELLRVVREIDDHWRSRLPFDVAERVGEAAMRFIDVRLPNRVELEGKASGTSSAEGG